MKKEMRLKYYHYQNDATYDDGYPKVVLALFYGGMNIADVCFEFNKPATKPSDDSRNGCNVYAQLSFQADPIQNAMQAIGIALQTVDCSSYQSIVADYAANSIPDDVPNGSNGYLVVNPALY